MAFCRHYGLSSAGLSFRLVMGIHKEYVLFGLHLHKEVCGNYAMWKEIMLDMYGEKASAHIIDIRRWVIGVDVPDGPLFYKKPNCWEFMGCGCVDESSCPAMSYQDTHGVHGGVNGGRACWSIPGTRCGSSIQTTPEQKRETCSECDFHISVKSEEGAMFSILPIGGR